MRLFATTATAVLLLLSLTVPNTAGATSGGRGVSHTEGRTITKKKARHRKAVRSHPRKPSWSENPSRGGAPTTGNSEASQGYAPSSGPNSPTGVTSPGTGGKKEKAGETQPSPVVPTIPVAPTTPAAPPAPTPPSGSTPPASSETGNPGSILYKNNFEGNWGASYVQSMPGRATISSRNPFEGTGVGRFEVRPGDVEPDTGAERSEISGPTFNEGAELYVRVELRIPTSYSYQGSWQLINQLHEANWGGPPGMATLLDANRRIDIQSGTGEPLYWRGPQLESERWYDVVYHVKLSQDPSQGFVEVWLDGAQQTMVNGQTRMFGKTIQAAQTYFKAGIYRCMGSSGVSLIEYDDIVIGTNLSAVMSV